MMEIVILSNVIVKMATTQAAINRRIKSKPKKQRNWKKAELED